jgi:hypothetical protein
MPGLGTRAAHQVQRDQEVSILRCHLTYDFEDLRPPHVGASTELDTVANEVVQVVNVMDGLNRFRFGKDGELLAAWENVSNVLATPRPSPAKPASDGGASAGGEVRPAA